MLGGGLLHGQRRSWHESGGVASEELFEHGVRLWGKEWDEAGNLIEDFGLQESDPT
jgi:antitoxin component YwqK of YwqJK toxin-antitoxin module